LALLHGGSCRVENATTGGARFIVELPGAVPVMPRSAEDVEHPGQVEHVVLPHEIGAPV
jgi:hypothetical protein